MQSSTKNSYQTFLSDFLKYDVLVECPSCSKLAIVKQDKVDILNTQQSKEKVICTHCGYNKTIFEKPYSIIYSSKNDKIIGRQYLIGAPIDPLFHLPLWLKTTFEGNILWAYNIEHLSFLQHLIEAKLRERNGQETFNSSLGSRLPKWMTSKKNRDAILKKLIELKNK